ncbi:amidohydrolase [Nitratireductor aestuarii]|uniref:Amidohydrolase n=1 Tax=Nitratireductor aestuarii TaxID=1735103 RepID=A0A916RJ02_9HYPH|nr:cytosine deaminase [Nitratireductor aestuarii]GGA58177.1 amidohydrolase [Nitratireductor aestuarii]
MSGETPYRPVSLVNVKVPAALASGLELRDHDPVTGLAVTDFAIDGNGRISLAANAPSVDMGGRMVLPCFIDSHVHLDKAFIIRRTGVPQGGLLDAIHLATADIPNRTRDDLAERMEKGLSFAYSRGTSVMRTHLDTPEQPVESASWKVFTELRETWRDRITLQAVALMALERVDTDEFPERCRQIAEIGGVVGAFVPTGSATSHRLDKLFEIAAHYGLDVDFHVDESLDPNAIGLELIAESVLRTGFKGRVVAGHCCSLSVRPEAEVAALIDKVAEAGIYVISLPHSNLYLQDRQPGRTPRMRGLTLAHELRAAGVSVHFASDNVQDPFYPYGEFDMLEVMRSSIRFAHLDTAVGAWVPELYRNAAAALNLPDAGRIAAGAKADFIAFDATDWYDLFGQSHANRMVFRNGINLSSRSSDLRDLFGLDFA